MGCLDPRQLGRLTLAMYHDHPSTSWRVDKPLNDWEEAWFRADLPSPPAKILVGGAGKGREARALHEWEHRITAFDPVEAYIKQAPSIPGVTFLRGSYENLAAPDSNAARRFSSLVQRNAPYDAVLLGWGSFSHIPSEPLRRALLVTLKKLCPSGPVLASFFIDQPEHPEQRRRAWQWGFRLGHMLDSTRSRTANPHDRLGPTLGFSHSFTRDELRELARSAGYRISRWPRKQQNYPHATFRPVATDDRNPKG